MMPAHVHNTVHVQIARVTSPEGLAVTQSTYDLVIMSPDMQCMACSVACLQNHIRCRAAKTEGVVSERDKHTSLLPCVERDRVERKYQPAEFKKTIGKISVSTLVAPKMTIDVSPPSGGGGGGGGGGSGGEAERREGSRWKVVFCCH